MSSNDQSARHAPRFSLGRIVATPSALRAIPNEEILRALDLHASGHWGELDPMDRKANEVALLTDARLLSSYRSTSGNVFWIITEADRSSTCVLLPEDY
jgi:hypothetical protein